MATPHILYRLGIALVFALLINSVTALYCIQCDRQQAWYSPEDNERLIHLCQTGEIAPTKCQNSSHTHCIYSFFRQGPNPATTITERRCGRQEDIIGCTMYKSTSRRVRHLLGGGQPDPTLKTPVTRRREASLFVEVCTEGCEGDGCINAAPAASKGSIAFALLLTAIAAYLL